MKTKEIKRRQKVRTTIILLILTLLMIIIYSISSGDIVKIIDKDMLKSFVGDPIESDGTINNLYFGINEEGKYAKNTTEGINQAILYAKKNNINYIKLKKGNYQIDGSVKDLSFNNTKKGIILQSNMVFDLNGSTISQSTNNKERYSVICLYDIENVVVKNGRLIGDKQTHNYTDIKGTHEWGYGIDIKGSVNITIDNIEISEMTGDGVCVSDLKEKDNENHVIMPSENVNISNCNIYTCRRQGISAISVKGLNIYHNEIHNIKGTNPQAAIDLETNDDGTQLVDNVKIYENKLYDLGFSTAILNYSRIYRVEIYDNEINGKIVIYQNNDQIYIHNNRINDADIIAKIEDKQYNQGIQIQKVIIENNVLNNSHISINRTQNVFIDNNSITNGQIEINSSNGEIKNNKISTQSKRNYAFKYGILEGDDQQYTYIIKDNVATGTFEKIEIKQENENILYR